MAFTGFFKEVIAEWLDAADDFKKEYSRRGGLEIVGNMISKARGTRCTA
ncbi:hypothetical protein [Halodesulfovibrio marinisediminis]|uniref:Uncharacterized protein n=1 Tax=Halodesulfovibrio marinisediminis DSM 17456 TaxID=1121457 RepID=A0A1N6H5T1_9BACT|nr:hypothetical protein [Halodesulfovibrio marinisediminis]SIO15092.1 hypothetical protein SAMN02745161_2021 [Halodesulfovibrio marinisediminis DSM 17456]